MAIIQANYFSTSLVRTVNFTAIVPLDRMESWDKGTGHAETTDKLKTLYLLHGVMGSDIDWITGTRIARWAQERNLAVIMPAAENKFYIDNEKSIDKFATYIGEELVNFTRKLFPLSDKREDTFIAGLSMGGYGAIINGLNFNDTFGYIGGFSSALSLDKMIDPDESSPFPFSKKSYYEAIFGNLNDYPGSRNDYIAASLRLLAEHKGIPKIFMAIGTEDFLLESNREYRDFLIENKIDHYYEEGPGGHDWDFWDTHIKNFLDWLPLNTKATGINSGNVGK